jgi:hypothetical protein
VGKESDGGRRLRGLQLGWLRRGRGGGGRRNRRKTGDGTPLFEDRETPPTLGTFLANVLFTDASPENVVVGECSPALGDLCSPAERCGIQMLKDLETEFVRKDNEGVYANEMSELLCEQGELGEAAHGQEALENETPAGMRGGGKGRPNGVDLLSFFKREGVERLWGSQLELVGAGKQENGRAGA